ncbi:cobaltochelatase subunit CobN [Porphyromonas pogonae]|uniref:cobaltochelatase subunit CobN n=1 Tax=Porphyromonas pogonae TaxID=867595 RepID=UPI0038B5DA7B
MKKRTSFTILVIAICALLLLLLWNKYASSTKIALVNFPQYQASGIIVSNKDKNIKFKEVTLEKLSDLKSYDCVLAFGMGLKLTQEQRDQMQKIADNGTPLLVIHPTSPENIISSLDSIEEERIIEYYDNGNKKNYQSLARYIRKDIDGKKWFVNDPDTVVNSASEVYYHLNEDLSFNNIKSYEGYLKKIGHYRDGAAKVMIVGGLNDPYSGNRDNIDSLITSLEVSGLNVYPVSSFSERIKFLQEVNPDLVVYFAHGRLAMGNGDAAVEYLKARNIPILAPLSILQTEKEWSADPMGMAGGFLSQSVVMPELDGAIYPFVLTTQEKNDDGLYLLKTVPERLKTFTELVNRFIALKRKENSEKKVAIYYFKGPGKETLTAQGLETIPSLYNLLKRLRGEGYNLAGLPETVQAFEKQLMEQGQILTTYAEGAFDEYLRTGNPALVADQDFKQWIQRDLSVSQVSEMRERYGEIPGRYMSRSISGKRYLAVARVQYGNVVVLPQPMAGIGDDTFAIIHGAKMAPPYPYVAAYLWARNDFKADAIMHFGTHGSLEFTPAKQVALCGNDWADRLVGPIPHFYYYTIGNVGESIIAKRRSYAATVSYLTPPFTESKTREIYSNLQKAIKRYYEISAPGEKTKQSLEVKKLAVQMGIHRELRLDSTLSKPYTDKEVEQIDNFAEEIASEKINGRLYTTGEVYTPEKIASTVLAMSSDPIAFSMAKLDQLRSKDTGDNTKNKRLFNEKYLAPAQALVRRLLNSGHVDEGTITSYAHLTKEDIEKSHTIMTPPRGGMAAMMAAMSAKRDVGGKSDNKANRPRKMPKGHPSWIPIPAGSSKPGTASKSKGHPGNTPAGAKSSSAKPAAGGHPHGGGKPIEKTYTKAEREYAMAVLEIEQSILNVINYKNALEESPKRELDVIVNALGGGYIAPTSGGDAVANPQAVPTGRNLYSINAESTPSERAWSKGVMLADNTLKQYKERHGKYPIKVSYTFWSSEFIETEGATIAQVLYMLGVQPVRDMFGRVSDLSLIPSKQLGRPRIDVVVQTSGQFRDLAASRLSLITRAIEMASNAGKEEYPNYVADGTVATEKSLVEEGLSPKEARELSTTRVFGGINGMYGTGIQEMIKAGDKWDNEKQIAEVYLQNMGAAYGTEKQWGNFTKHLFKAALKNTDVVVQPRQSNTWGALSLDHVYEFMGGLNLTVRNVTGKDPDAFFADYRNRNHVHMQELKEAVGVESRATILNPEYVKEVISGGASSVARITDVVTNTYGWNVAKPDVIDNELWNDMYDMYIKDVHSLGVKQAFEKVNPAAMQEITAVMLETVRKGMWKASAEQIATMSNLHTELVDKYGSTGAGFSGSNTKLHEFIARNISQDNARKYQSSLKQMQTASSRDKTVDDKGVVMKKQEIENGDKPSKKVFNGLMVVGVVLICFILLLIMLRNKRKKKS